MAYVDGFVIPVPRQKLDAYRRMSRKAGKVWREHGALARSASPTTRPRARSSLPPERQAQEGETVVFSWITYKSRAHRDRVNKKVMKDPRLADMMGAENMRTCPSTASG